MIVRHLFARQFCLLIAIAAVTCGINRAAAVTISLPVPVGTVSSSTLDEISGVVGSRSLSNTLWVHNDSGDAARFYAVSTGGTLLGQFTLTSASATDWEDIAIGPKPGGGNYLYLADIGDNAAARSQVTIYRATEPTSATSASIAAANYTTLNLQYQGGARDAESLIVDPISGDIFVVSKETTARVFRAPASAFDTPAQVATLSLMGNLGSLLPAATAADISPDGRHILVRGYTTAYLFERALNESVWDALQRSGTPFTLASETQGEAIGWAANGLGFYTTSEWNTQAAPVISYYAFSVPEPDTLTLSITGVLAALLFAFSSTRRSSIRAR